MRISLGAGMILLTVLISACATTVPHATVSSIGPYQNFTGRLIIIEPTRRWQVMIDWNGQPERGKARLTHAASNRIVMVSWEGDRTRMSDNQNPVDGWKFINNSQLQSMGVILPPQKLAMILNGRIPRAFKEQKPNQWRGKIDGTLLLLKWNDSHKKLEITDTAHGKKAILMIQP